MSELVGWLNSAGGEFILFAIRMLIQSSVLLLILWLLDLVLRCRIQAVVRYWMDLDAGAGQAGFAAVAVGADRSDFLAGHATARGGHAREVLGRVFAPLAQRALDTLSFVSRLLCLPAHQCSHFIQRLLPAPSD